LVISEHKWQKVKAIVEAMATFTGERDYDSDSDRTSYNCPFCPAWWEEAHFQEWWTDEIKADHMDVRLEKHDKDCPVYQARLFIGKQPNADPVICPICGKENWHNKSGWNGTEEEYNLFWDNFYTPDRDKLNKEVKAGCCQECEEVYKLYKLNRFHRKDEARRQELARPGQLEKEREDTRQRIQRHNDRAGIKGIVKWSDRIHGFEVIQTPEEAAHNQEQADKRVAEFIQLLKEKNSPNGSGSNEQQN
jgi:hypothetical protein